MRQIVITLLVSCSTCSINVKSPESGSYDNEAGELKPAERTQIVELANDFRSRAAKGLIVNKGGKNLANGEEIYAVTYNVSLEKRARDCISKCETAYRPAGDKDTVGFIFLLLRSNMDAADALNALYGFAAGQAAKYGIRESLAYYDPDVLAWSQLAFYRAKSLGCAVHYCDLIEKTLTLCLFDSRIFTGTVAWIPSKRICNDDDCTFWPKAKCNTTSALCYVP